MTYLALAVDKTTHDITFTGGNLGMVTDAEAVAQRVKQHLRFFQGEWFLNRSIGVPYFEYVFVQPFDQATAEAVIKNAVVAVPGVRRIMSFGAKFFPRRREFRVYEMKLLTEFDEVVTVNG